MRPIIRSSIGRVQGARRTRPWSIRSADGSARFAAASRSSPMCASCTCTLCTGKCPADCCRRIDRPSRLLLRARTRPFSPLTLQARECKPRTRAAAAEASRETSNPASSTIYQCMYPSPYAHARRLYLCTYLSAAAAGIVRPLLAQLNARASATRWNYTLRTLDILGFLLPPLTRRRAHLRLLLSVSLQCHGSLLCTWQPFSDLFK